MGFLVWTETVPWSLKIKGVRNVSGRSTCAPMVAIASRPRLTWLNGVTARGQWATWGLHASDWRIQRSQLESCERHILDARWCMGSMMPHPHAEPRNPAPVLLWAHEANGLHRYRIGRRSILDSHYWPSNFASSDPHSHKGNSRTI